MHSKYAELTAALTEFGEKLQKSAPDSRSVMEVGGNQWNLPAVDGQDLRLLADQACDAITERAPDEFDPADERFVAGSIRRIQLLQASTLGNIWNGNGASAVPVIMLSLQAIRDWAFQTWPDQVILRPGTLPYQLAKRARNAKAKLDEITEHLGEIEGKISLILEAHQAAEALPADMQDLREARDSIQRMRDSARGSLTDIENSQTAAAEASKGASQAAGQAEGYAKKSSQAYGFTTSHGLAAAFDARSKAIARSVWVWVGFLVAALAGAGLLGHSRVVLLTQLLADTDPKWGVVALNLTLSVVSVGAPLWFAWIATKQIGQRFRLAEDYGFKASVAKAYEGYKNEAIALDPSFAHALFGVALDRLREAPIRLVEEALPGSPWHEILKDPAVSDALRSVPNAANRISDFCGDLLSKFQKAPSQSAKSTAGTEG